MIAKTPEFFEVKKSFLQLARLLRSLPLD